MSNELVSNHHSIQRCLVQSSDILSPRTPQRARAIIDVIPPNVKFKTRSIASTATQHTRVRISPTTTSSLAMIHFNKDIYIKLLPIITQFSEMDFLKIHNLSILVIPAYYILALAPNAYSISLCSATDRKARDNTNSRGTNQKDKLKVILSSEDYATYERAEAVHANAMENIPLSASTIIIANAAGLKRSGFQGINGFVGMWFLCRTGHTLSSVYTTRRKTSFLRSGVWALSVGLCFRMFVKAAKTLNGGLL